nr:CDP-alcohol phosphatidyltransferase family protein [Sphingomonas montana]
MAERTRRLGTEAGLDGEGGSLVLVNADFAADVAWIRHVAAHPGLVITLDGVPALCHPRTAAEAEPLRTAMLQGRALIGSEAAGFDILAYEDGPTVENKTLRKRETPFLMRLRPETRQAVERASYFGAYKGVTDLLTKYLWPEWALWLTRLCARLGVTPNMVTIVGAIFCIAAPFAFADGRYWLGMALGLVFMVLDTVDGKLARCTLTSSVIGNMADHGLDLVHPPFWFWFWGTGLASWGLALPEKAFAWTMAAILCGYVAQRVIEGVFMRQNGMMHIHVWTRFDSAFRLVTARRNPNMVILFVSMLFSRPDLGLKGVAWWTVASCLVHLVRLVQARLLVGRGGTVTSWLAEP